MGNKCMLRVYDHKRLRSEGLDCEPDWTTLVADSKITSGVWGLYDETIVTGHDNGMIGKYDLKVRNPRSVLPRPVRVSCA